MRPPRIRWTGESYETEIPEPPAPEDENKLVEARWTGPFVTKIDSERVEPGDVRLVPLGQARMSSWWQEL